MKFLLGKSCSTNQTQIQLDSKKEIEFRLFILRPFLIQSDLSVENGRFRLKPKSGFLYTFEKGLFRLNLFRLSFPTGGSSRKTRLFRLKLSVEKPSRKTFTPVFLTHRIAHPTTKHKPTRPHTHTRYHTAVSHNSADAALAITAVASRRKSAWRTPSSARQQHISHDSSSARYRCHFANNDYACCSFGGSRLSATPRT